MTTRVRWKGPRSIGPVPDGLSEDMRRFLESIRSATSAVIDGTVAREQIAAGIVAGGGGGDGTGGGSETDLTPPPSPFDVVVAAGVDYVGVVTGNPTFTTGNGYDRTIVYGAKYPGTGPLPTFASAAVVHEFRGEVGTFPTEPAQQWHIWVSWRSRDGVTSTTVVGGVNGFIVTTGQITDAMVAEINASKIRAGSLSVGEYIQSSGFVPLTTAGFRIDGNGGFEVRNVGGTRIFNLNASGTQPVLRVAQTIGGPGLEILGNGSVNYQGGITASTITGGTITGTLIQTAASGQRVTINEAGSNEARFYGNRGDGTVVELASIGINSTGFDPAIIALGAPSSSRTAIFAQSTGTTILALSSGPNVMAAIRDSGGYPLVNAAILATSSSGIGLYAQGNTQAAIVAAASSGSGISASSSSGSGVSGVSATGHGASFTGNGTRSALFLAPVATLPPSPPNGSVAVWLGDGVIFGPRLCFSSNGAWLACDGTLI